MQRSYISYLVLARVNGSYLKEFVSLVPLFPEHCKHSFRQLVCSIGRLIMLLKMSFCIESGTQSTLDVSSDKVWGGGI